jgi:membrane protease YdiL (CAAX protease family)
MSVTEPGTGKGSVFQWACIFYLVLAVAGIIWIGVRHGTIERALFIAPGSWPIDLGMGLGVGGALTGVWEIARRLLPQPLVVERHFAEVLGPMTVSEAVVLALLSALAEELFFRGAMQAAFGLLPAAALFTVLHLGPGKDFRLWTVFAAVAGIVLGGLMLWRGSLLAPVAAHALVNGIGLARLADSARSKGGQPESSE